jgi:hypothetical protein
LFVLRGTVFYDRNANGERDSNVDVEEFGNDVEYNYGLGGVNIRLVECDLETGMEMRSDESEEEGGSGSSSSESDSQENSYAQAVSLGYDVLMHPKLVDRREEGGK